MFVLFFIVLSLSYNSVVKLIVSFVVDYIHGSFIVRTIIVFGKTFSMHFAILLTYV